ncbi:TfuA-like protein [Streptomyces anandii]|uniref:TfuA-like protein n=1 Tax=Streptomyces anandii TaxID=285454 RepID=UPI0037B8D45D
MIWVFTGPSLPADDPVLAGPGVRVLGPAGHGDLFRLPARAGDTVVLIDGVYHQAPAVRHKELLAVLAAGVRVIGAASIGALRAVELEAFGMEGVGAVVEGFRSGLLRGDDEVAVGQDPVDASAVTWPLVNVRQVLAAARAAQVLEEAVAGRLLEALRRVYYAQRSTAAVRAVCRREGADAFVQWLEERRAAYPRFGDVKWADAWLAVRTAMRTPGGPVVRPPMPGSVYFGRWRSHFAVQEVDGLVLPTRLRVAYQQVFHRGFPSVWASALDYLSRHPRDGSPGMGLRERCGRCVDGGPVLPVHLLFRVEPDLSDAAVVEVLLAEETAQDRAAVARYMAADERARRQVAGFTAESVRDDVAVRVLSSAWRCPAAGLEEEAAARGLYGTARALQAVKPFIAGLLEDKDRARVGREGAGAHV